MDRFETDPAGISVLARRPCPEAIDVHCGAAQTAPSDDKDCSPAAIDAGPERSEMVRRPATALGNAAWRSTPSRAAYLKSNKCEERA